MKCTILAALLAAASLSAYAGGGACQPHSTEPGCEQSDAGLQRLEAANARQRTDNGKLMRDTKVIDQYRDPNWRKRARYQAIDVTPSDDD